ncbi:DUF1289 domain-containing protein [Allorhizobium pseudoryzae]|uniref:DUF1289 domain-containing protein n=1 Tax=Allorhizobium pseudoryzae TaxID=379684 RepID=UPI003D06BD2F
MITPCIRVCTIHEETALCLGCGRTLGEIASWSRYTNEGREKVMAELPSRMAALARSGLLAGGDDATQAVGGIKEGTHG